MPSPFYTPLLIAVYAATELTPLAQMPFISALASTFAPTVTAGTPTLSMPFIPALAQPFAPVLDDTTDTLTMPFIAALAATYPPDVSPTGEQNLTMPFIAALASPFAPAVTDPDAHEWWRILVAEAASTNPMELGEIQMRATVGGADQCTGGSSFASTGVAHASAFDDNNTTDWTASSGAVPQHIGYHFAAPVKVTELYMDTNALTRGPTDFQAQWSDDSTNGTDGTWTTQYKSLDLGGLDWTTDVPRTWLVRCPYSLRLTYTANNGGSSTVIREMEFRASAAGADETSPGFPGPSAFGTNAHNHELSDNLFDDDINATWSPVATTGVLRYDFDHLFALFEYMIHVGATTSQTPRDWVLAESTDGGVTWTTIDTITANTFTTNQQKVFVI